jgi:hypothetical protein
MKTIVTILGAFLTVGAYAQAVSERVPKYIFESHSVPAVEIEDIPHGLVTPMYGDRYTPSSFKLKREEIMRMPGTDIRDLLTLSPSVYQMQRGAEVSMSGSRPHGVLYVIDGMWVPRN